MGSWHTITLGKESALDWIEDLEESDGVEFLEETLASIEFEFDGYLDRDGATCYLCVAEVLCALADLPCENLPDTVENWVSRNDEIDPESIRDLAIEKVERVIAADSELRDTARECSAEFPNWDSSIRELLDRLATI